MDDIRLYDFKKSEKFSLENIRNLTYMCEEFCKSSNMQIDYETKNDSFRMVLDKSTQTSYGEFIEGISADTIIMRFSIISIVDNLTLFLDKSVALSLVDLLLGGDGKVNNKDREPTNIDLELIRYLFDSLLKRIRIPKTNNGIKIVKMYNNKIQYQKVIAKEMVFSSKINIFLENKIIGCIKLCIPYENIKNIIDDFNSSSIEKEINVEENEVKNISSSEVFPYIKDINMDVFTELGKTKVNISDLINLNIGDVIILDQKINEDVIVSVGEYNTYKAKMGVYGVKRAVEIVDIIK